MAALIAACVTLLGFFLQYGPFSPDGGGKDVSSASTPTASVTKESGSSGSGASEPPTEVPPTESTSSPLPTVQYLDSMKTLGEEPDTGLVTIDGSDYSHTVMEELWGCNSSVVEQLDYDLQSKWKTFSAHIGITSNSDPKAKVSFRVYLDGVPHKKEYVFTYRESDDIEVDVSGVGQLRLETEIYRDGENCDPDAYGAWGEAQLRR
ncbi:NPCBM/NEW2 domain-containing protein [Streptomyces europaeiscabiei]|uniref:NPCBM/NEW2 domain-containing protein n=1 Tax=Streptomyces europaeiscabiei TaxID=146819 RepID=A0AAJ2PNN3_9ACTN|nr:NPCBM/NEW2 domain-containing protein [Streptomyces europaeiscabiei]MDX3130812.1 NPCBM/NEW2 domain-containing protein [Streptomyces europaeiscabiei]